MRKPITDLEKEQAIGLSAGPAPAEATLRLTYRRIPWWKGGGVKCFAECSSVLRANGTSVNWTSNCATSDPGKILAIRELIQHLNDAEGSDHATDRQE